MTAIETLFVSDGRPGHYHLTEGILAAAERLRPLNITKIEIRRPVWLTPGMLWRLSRSGMSPALVLGYAYGIDASKLPKAELIVSAGGDTLAANIAASRLTGASNIFYGSLRRYAPEDFALVLTSYERNADKPRHAMTLKPSRLDPDQLPNPSMGSAGPAIAGLLVGGNAGTVRYEDEDWGKLFELMEAAYAENQTRWIVSNSPRTPAAFSDKVRRQMAKGNGVITQFIDVREAGTGTLEELYACADAIVCTADSSSMLSECVWARRPVLSVHPKGMTLPADEQGYRRHLEEHGWTRSLAIAALTPQRMVEELSALKPLSYNPLQKLGALLSDRLPDIFTA